MENDFFISRARANSCAGRKEMIDKEHSLPITKQCRILNLSRSGIYYKPDLVSDKDKDLMRIIDEIHLEEPYLGLKNVGGCLKDLDHF